MCPILQFLSNFTKNNSPRWECHQLSVLADNPNLYHTISEQLIQLEDEFSYVLNQHYRFKLRHDQDKDYFYFFKYLADHQTENVFTLLFRDKNGVILGCCQLVFQYKGQEVWAYFCDLKVKKSHRRHALKTLIWYLITDTFFNQRSSLLHHYCQRQGTKTVDIKLYFVNMGGQAINHNGLLRICRRFAWLFNILKVFLKQKVFLQVHLKRGYIANCNSDDVADSTKSQKQLILFNQHTAPKPLALYHAHAKRPIHDDPKVDYERTVLMGLTDTPTQQAFTLFYCHQNGQAINITDLLEHSGKI